MSEAYPLDTLALPYECDDPSCGHESAYSTDRYRAVPVFRGDAWEVSVIGREGTVDVFRDRDLNEALRAIHEAYPNARFNPEA